MAFCPTVQIAAPGGFSTHLADPALTAPGFAASMDGFTRSHHGFCIIISRIIHTSLGLGKHIFALFLLDTDITDWTDSLPSFTERFRDFRIFRVQKSRTSLFQKGYQAESSVNTVISGRQLKRTYGGTIPTPRLVYWNISPTRYRPSEYFLPNHGKIGGPK